jgi:hypothetical protein
MSAEETPADFKEKLRSVGVLRRTEVGKREPALAKDRDSYRRLRNEGLQPRTVAGSAALEATMDHRFEAELGHVFPAEKFPDRAGLVSRIEEGAERAREMEEWRQANDA